MDMTRQFYFGFRCLFGGLWEADSPPAPGWDLHLVRSLSWSLSTSTRAPTSRRLTRGCQCNGFIRTCDACSPRQPRLRRLGAASIPHSVPSATPGCPQCLPLFSSPLQPFSCNPDSGREEKNTTALSSPPSARQPQTPLWTTTSISWGLSDSSRTPLFIPFRGSPAHEPCPWSLPLLLLCPSETPKGPRLFVGALSSLPLLSARVVPTHSFTLQIAPPPEGLPDFFLGGVTHVSHCPELLFSLFPTIHTYPWRARTTFSTTSTWGACIVDSGQTIPSG